MEQPEYWANPPHSRYWEEVKEGDELPRLEFPLTRKAMLMHVAGTRDFMPYHFDSEYTKTLTPSRDIFVNTPWHQALIGRFCTDWSGPESDIRAMALQMVGQLCLGDVALVQGAISRKYQPSGDCLVEIDVQESNHLGATARAKVTLAMPSRASGPVRPRLRLEKPQIEPNEDMPDFARPWLGKVTPPTWGAYPVSIAQIMYFCDMVEDGNPLYVDGEYARKGRYGGVIAPWHSLIVWGMQRPGHMGIDADAPDTRAPQRKPWPPRENEERAMPFLPPGATDFVATQTVQEYGPPLRPGDRTYSSSQMVTCSPLRETRLGKGYFITSLAVTRNQRHEIVGTHCTTLLRYSSPSRER